MVKAESSREGGCKVEGCGSMPEQLNDLLNIIGSLYTGFVRADAGLASAFRLLLLLHLTPESKVWDKVQGEGYTVAVPEKEGGGVAPAAF